MNFYLLRAYMIVMLKSVDHDDVSVTYVVPVGELSDISTDVWIKEDFSLCKKHYKLL